MKVTNQISQTLNSIPAWKSLKKHAASFNYPDKHLKYLIKENNRLEKFSLKCDSILYDFSHQRVDEKAMRLLFELAEARRLKEQFISMVNGTKINISENRAALHTALRNFSDNPIFIDEKDVMPEIIKTRNNIKEFASKVHNGEIVGSTGKPFKYLVVIGIGGSYLGTKFVSYALKSFADKDIKIYFLSNIDTHNFEYIISQIEPETTLWIVVSKSYTTTETIANTNLAISFMKEKNLQYSKHVVTITSKGSPGDDPANPVLASFYMFDFIGGRYSVTSAVGGVPLSLYLGYEKFEQFLKGAEKMDIHAMNYPCEKNIPLVAALIAIWNNNFLGYQTQAIIPYASPLKKLASHIQQLSMESNGKSVTKEGSPIDEPAGAVVFGELGTNAQHSFFQLAYQGRPFPIEFIGVIKPQYEQYDYKSKGITNYQELWANMISQPRALALGQEENNKIKYCPGNRPSSTILINDLSPKSLGYLLSFYEARTVFEAFILGINPFDQFGVELGKKLASDIRKEIASKNEQIDHQFKNMDNITKFYLDTMFSGKL